MEPATARPDAAHDRVCTRRTRRRPRRRGGLCVALAVLNAASAMPPRLMQHVQHGALDAGARGERRHAGVRRRVAVARARRRVAASAIASRHSRAVCSGTSAAALFASSMARSRSACLLRRALRQAHRLHHAVERLGVLVDGARQPVLEGLAALGHARPVPATPPRSPSCRRSGSPPSSPAPRRGCPSARPPSRRPAPATRSTPRRRIGRPSSTSAAPAGAKWYSMIFFAGSNGATWSRPIDRIAISTSSRSGTPADLPCLRRKYRPASSIGASGVRPTSSEPVTMRPSFSASSRTVSKTTCSGVVRVVEQVDRDLRLPVLLDVPADGAHGLQAARHLDGRAVGVADDLARRVALRPPALADVEGDLVGQPPVERVQVDVVGEQELARADHGGARAGVEPRRARHRAPRPGRASFSARPSYSPARMFARLRRSSVAAACS